jgi:isoquinoline 1-oxidoreductase beta subunit
MHQSRREFLLTVRTGLVLTVAGGSVLPLYSQSGESDAFSPSHFLAITAQGDIKVFIGQGEMGQDIYTGLSILVAEELGALVEDIEVVAAPVDPAFGNSFFPGNPQMTAASSSMKVFYKPFRHAGATARAMLLNALSLHQGHSVSDLKIRKGLLTFNETSTLAVKDILSILRDLPIPKSVTLKASKDFEFIGKSQRSLNLDQKTHGALKYGLDLKLPGALTAVVKHPPSFGAKIVSFDDSAVISMAGIKEVIQIPSGIAVIGDNYWIANEGKKALKVKWDESAGKGLSTDNILSEYQALGKKTGTMFTVNPIPGMDYQIAQGLGPEKYATKYGGTTLESEFFAPYLAHAPMEPLNCTILEEDGIVHVYVGTHYQFADNAAIAKTLGLSEDKIKLHTLPMGGSFGRRACPDSDWIVEAANIYKYSDAAVLHPIKLIWSREDDITGGWYRPLVYSKISAALTENGRIGSWGQRIIGQAAIDHNTLSFVGPENIDLTTVDAVGNIVYDIEDRVIDVHHTNNDVPVQWMRSVGHSHNVFFVETFMSELAESAEIDQLEFRLKHIKDERTRRVLNLVAEKGGWSGGFNRSGHAQGLSVHEFYGTYVANLAEVEKTKEGHFRIVKLVFAADLGRVVNPDAVEAQMESGAILAMSSAFYGEINIVDGVPQETNFDSYKALRFAQCPEIETHLVSSDLDPSGAGETGVPSVAPAICNALAKHLRHHIKYLPITKHGIKIV